MSRKILITSALPYANGPLHFGHLAGAYLPGDVYARFQRLRGEDVLYICGSDEYGVAITMSAEAAGRSPKEHVDIFHAVNSAFFQQLNFSFDHYSRTTWQGHIAPSQRFFLDLLEQGYIEEKVTEQLYAEKEQKFLADRYVMGTCPSCGYPSARGDECQKCGASYEATDLKNPVSKVTGSPLVLKETTHWFLLLDKFKEPLMQWVGERNWKPNVVNFVKNYIDDLRPRAITRDSTWGVPVPLPHAQGKVLYVWFDAPIGYISATMEWAQLQGNPERWRDYWQDPETKLVHFIGKDNIPFHTVTFPAMLMKQKEFYVLPEDVPANEFLNLEGRQFSKSDGWTIDLEEFFQRYSTDQIRYAIAANAPETSDSEFTWKEFQLRCNAELVGKYGNLVHRTLTFAQKECQGKVPALHLEERDQTFLTAIHSKVAEIVVCYEQYRVRKASQLIMELAQEGNVYFDHKQPWKEAKDPAKRVSMETTVACCLEAIKLLALVSSPLIPASAQKIWLMLGQSTELAGLQWNEVAAAPLPAGQTLPPPAPLFSKIDDAQIAQEIEKLHQMNK